MSDSAIVLIFFPYGLAFFSLGLILAFERRRGPVLLRNALRPLAGFGLVHGSHEWIEMFQKLGYLPLQLLAGQAWSGFRIILLAISFLSLAAFGVAAMAEDEYKQQLTRIVPLLMSGVWAIGILSFRGMYGVSEVLWVVADVWTRYSLAIPGAILAAIGLIYQQRRVRQGGMSRFGRDCLWAAIAFVWYGIIGQIFVQQSPLPPSNLINQDLFQSFFNFPVQILRAVSAVSIAVFVVKFLRSFEVERQIQLEELQANQLRESREREEMKGELLKQVVDAQEAERQRIARELHDATGQALTALGLGLRGISAKLRGADPDTARKLIELETLTSKSLDELRLLITDLRPSHLDEFGLSSALRWYVGDITERVPFSISLTLPRNNPDLPSSIKTALFRVVQEAVTNTIKHAQADNLSIILSCRPNGDVRLEIEDDGVGFIPLEISEDNSPTWGLLGMQERTHLCGGDFSLLTAPGEGTLIQVSIPNQVWTNKQVENDH